MITKPKGTKDIYGKKAKVWKYIEEVIDSVMEKYNYNYIRTPIFESSELFHRGIGDSSDIVKKETYDFKDRGERNMTLRPEGTANARLITYQGVILLGCTSSTNSCPEWIYTIGQNDWTMSAAYVNNNGALFMEMRKEYNIVVV